MFEYRQHAGDSGVTLNYRLFVPSGYAASKVYPLVVTLHGVGENGTDNVIHIEKNRIAEIWAEDSNQAKEPCFVASPQNPDGSWTGFGWVTDCYNQDDYSLSPKLATVMELIDSLTREFSIDTNRIYVAGLSIGGFAAWDIMTRFPGVFAAAIIMSSAADTGKAHVIAHMPVWVFHGALDVVVPVQGSRNMVGALERARGEDAVYTHCRNSNCSGMTPAAIAAAVAGGEELLYTEYQNKNHNMWIEGFNEPWVYEWMMSKKRKPDTRVVFGTTPLREGLAPITRAELDLTVRRQTRCFGHAATFGLTGRKYGASPSAHAACGFSIVNATDSVP